jgi:glycerol uptake facilitator protein
MINQLLSASSGLDWSSGTTWIKFVISEIFGTFALVFFGNGAVACYELKHTKGSSKNARGGLNWFGVGFGYGFGTMLGVIWSGFSDHHINPAADVFEFFIYLFNNHATIYDGQPWLIFIVIIVQIIGAMMAQLMLDLIFLISIKSTEDQNAVFAMHATTRPKSENSSVKLQYTIAFITEAFGTLILLLTLKSTELFGQDLLDLTGNSEASQTFITGIMAGFVVMLLVISIGGVTGPALNPARDLGPRIVYTIIPLPGRDRKLAEWNYSWVPTLAPVVGAVFAALIFIGLDGI